MDDIAVVEAAEHMEDRIGLADIGQELVAEAFAFAGAPYEAGYINDIDCCRDCPFRLAHFGQHLKPLVRDVGGSEIRLDCTEREVGALGLAGAYAIEECRFADVRQSDDSTFKRHILLFSIHFGTAKIAKDLHMEFAFGFKHVF